MYESLPVLVAAWYFVFLFSTTMHEGAHALLAHLTGDTTAQSEGLVTLDPIPHIRRSPFGMLIIPLISCVMYHGAWMIGWASVPYNVVWANRNPRKAALMAAAGPGTNLILGILAFIGLRIGLAAGFFEHISPFDMDLTHYVGGTSRASEIVGLLLSIMVSENIILGIFNLIPLPPLDGSGIIPFFLTRNQALAYQKYMWNPTYRMFGLFVAWQIVARIVWPVIGFIMNSL